jgi:hypothetical protein
MTVDPDRNAIKKFFEAMVITVAVATDEGNAELQVQMAGLFCG